MAKRLLNKDQVLEEKLPGFNSWSLEYHIRTRQIPFFKMGKRIYFEEESLDKWISENMIEPMEVENERR